ncbi:hypothetical protein EIP86_006147 [Pleurotus ostreatoroseus]|nr:hypothetical protein EIP86_006147 [Pleurotus ostreatoroseus]
MFSELTIAYVWYSSQLSESNLQEFLWRRRPRGAHVFDWRSCLGGRDLKRARASLQPATALLFSSPPLSRSPTVRRVRARIPYPATPSVDHLVVERSTLQKQHYPLCAPTSRTNNMFSATILTTLLAAIAIARADPNPSEPSPGNIYNEGSTCHISWDVDTTGVWKTMNIELMTGPNVGMIHLTTVATVTPNAAIYFYQFTSPASSTTLWTGRFAIADANGKTTDPTNATQPGGDAIPWGTGALDDPSTAVAAPSKGTGSTVVSSSSNSTTVSSTGSAAAASSSSAADAPASPSSSASSGASSNSNPSPASSGSSKPAVAAASGASSTSGSAAAASSAAATGAAAANGAVGALAVSSRLVQAAATLGLVAFGYAVAL